jgi:peptidyl-prolyl cis-trans isomerase A (cyclophilin A)
MNRTNHWMILLFFMALINACSGGNEKKVTEQSDIQQKAVQPETANPFSELVNAVFTIQTYDGQRVLEKGKGFLLNTNTIVAPFSLFERATRAVITPLNGGDPIEITHYFTYDRINNLILLAVENCKATPLKLYGGTQTKGVKTIIASGQQNNTQLLSSGTCLDEIIVEGRRLLSISNMIGNVSNGTPVFVSNGSVLGMGISMEINYQKSYFAIPAVEILSLLKRKEKAQTLVSIRSANASRNASIKSIILHTDYGKIQLRLYNETHAYRDNFVKLTEEGFYDSLLIHRVIRDFGIQMGAADTRHARHDDIVGWKGPGYTLPAHIIPAFFHKRGAIGSPRKPDDKNQQRRSDGSQFYLVTGRKYTDDELNSLEKENGIVYSEAQRTIYKTLGGAPHLDGSYTVFGEVISGLEVADQISLLPVQGDFRPIADIRLKKIEIIY